MAPFDVTANLESWASNLVFLLIGMGFGAALEMSGFGDSRKLAAQFYFKDLTVLKVMFTGIVVAGVLIFLASALELVDFARLWVNPTYLKSGIAGGLIMGVGFIVGGFCPGTSLVAASTFKLDGVFFVLGAIGGTLAFGVTLPAFEDFYQATFLGRFTLFDWLGLPAGVVVMLLVAVALVLFWAAERVEAVVGAGRAWKDVRLLPERKGYIAAAAVLLGGAGLTALIGQPDVEDRYAWIAAEADRQLTEREVLVDPAELVELWQDTSLLVRVLDVRNESDFNRFHLAGARRLEPGATRDPAVVKNLLEVSENTITFLVSNDEAAAMRAWRDLRAQGVINLYVLEGGVNGWLRRYPPSPCVATPARRATADDELAWDFALSVGERASLAHPHLARHEYVPTCDRVAEGPQPSGHAAGHATAPGARPLVKKVKLQKKVVAKGGCG